MAQKTIAVIGSLNVDFITRTPRLPNAGETLTATSFDTGFGGKGANQAVACARLTDKDTRICMVGNVGDDSFGTDYLKALEQEGIDASLVRTCPGHKTGIANIIVEDETGENRILLATNANHAFSEQRDASWDMVPSHADVAVFQLEIPIAVVLHNMHQAGKAGKHVILNPAPALKLPRSAFKDIDTLILNETEARLLGESISNTTSTSDDLTNLMSMFLQLGVKDAVIITLGERGVIYSTTSGDSGSVPALKVKVVDTTAAGDTFLGAYAAKRVRHSTGEFDHREALDFATLAAGKTVQVKGAMAAIPHLSALA